VIHKSTGEIMTARWKLAVFPPLIAAGLFTVSCDSGPTAPQKGTPAFYWSAAQETFGSGDYLKTSDHLESLLRSDNEFRARAQPWQLVVTAGLADGFRDLADNFETGARSNKSNPTPFRRQVSDFRTSANRHALQFAEAFQHFLKTNKDEKIVLAFTYPTGSTAFVPQLKQVAAGILIPPPEITNAQKRALERGVLRSACRVAGAPDDSARAQALFKSGSVEIPRSDFVVAMAGALHDEAQIYAPGKGDQPDRMKTFCNLALDALKSVPESKESKELTAKIQGTLKKLRI
jgi:hypothetical protein